MSANKIPNLRESVMIPKKTSSKVSENTEGLQVIPEMNPSEKNKDTLILLLKKKDIRYVDRRTSGGALWLIGRKAAKGTPDGGENRLMC